MAGGEGALIDYPETEGKTALIIHASIYICTFLLIKVIS